MPVTKDQFRPGLVLVRRIAGPLFGYHYGVWVAVDEVIHASKDRRIVVCDSLKEFAAGRDLQISVYSSLGEAAPELVVERARAEVGKWAYDLRDGNCETFVLWCLTGTRSAGLQVGILKLIGELAESYVEPIKSARTKKRAVLEFERRVTDLLVQNLKENEEIRIELEHAIEKSKTCDTSVAIVDDDEMENALTLYEEWQLLLDRIAELRLQRMRQATEVLRQIPHEDDLETIQYKLNVGQRLNVAQKEWLDYETRNTKVLLSTTFALKNRIISYQFDQIMKGAPTEKRAAWSAKLYPNLQRRTGSEP